MTADWLSTQGHAVYKVDIFLILGFISTSLICQWKVKCKYVLFYVFSVKSARQWSTVHNQCHKRKRSSGHYKYAVNDIITQIFIACCLLYFQIDIYGKKWLFNHSVPPVRPALLRILRSISDVSIGRTFPQKAYKFKSDCGGFWHKSVVWNARRKSPNPDVEVRVHCDDIGCNRAKLPSLLEVFGYLPTWNWEANKTFTQSFNLTLKVLYNYEQIASLKIVIFVSVMPVKIN